MLKLIQFVLIIFISSNLQYIIAQDDGYTSMPISNSNAVNINTGSPSFSVPIWTLEGRSLKVPVVAAYAAKGLGVNQAPGILGTSWELIAGGYIVQETMGGNDFNLNGYMYKYNEFTDPPTYDYMRKVSNDEMDGEPDIFTYSLPGGSGKFVFSSFGFISLNKTNYKINYNANETFTIIDDNGISYHFNTKETTRFYVFNKEYDGGQRNFSYKWMLTEIVSANKTDTIKFDYKDGTYDSELVLNYSCFKTTDNSDIKSEEYGHYQSLVDKKDLTKISSATGTILFEYLETGKDVIKSIQILNNQNEIVKSFQLEYISPNNRILLSKLTEISATGNTLPPYQFYYLNISQIPAMPAQLQSDYGGFPGSKVDTSSFYPAGYSFKLPTTNAMDGMLYEIYYPAGSFLHFNYEQNTYSMPMGIWYDARWDGIMDLFPYYNKANFPGAGVRVKSILQGDGTNNFRTDYEYLSDDGSSSGRMTDYPVLEYSMPYTYFFDNEIKTKECIRKSDNLMNLFPPEIYYERVSIYHGGKIPDTNNGKNGSTINEYLIEPSTWVQNSLFYYPLRVSVDKEQSLLKSSKTYDKQGRIKSISSNNFKLENTGFIAKGIKVVSINTINEEYSFEIYNIHQRNIRIENSTNTTYDDNAVPSQNITNYIYSKPFGGEHTDFYQDIQSLEPEDQGIEYNSIYPLIVKTTNSKGNLLEKHLYYPSPYSKDENFRSMASDYNIRSFPVEEEVFENQLKIAGTKTVFNLLPGNSLLMPKSVSVFENGNYTEKSFFDKYNKYGMLTETHGLDYIHNSVIYGYKNSLPVAEITNAKASQVFYTSFEDTTGTKILTGDAKSGIKCHDGPFTFKLPSEPGNYLISYWEKINSVWVYNEAETNSAGSNYTISGSLIDEIRVHPVDAFMTTKTWKPMVGITSQTNTNGLSTYNDYDDFGRLKSNADQNKIETNRYSYNQASINDSYHFDIEGANSLAISCNGNMNAVLTGTQGNETINWQWFDNYCGGNLIGTGKDQNAFIPYNSFDDLILDGPVLFSKTYYVRPIINGKCLPCQEKKVDYLKPVFTIPASFEYNYQANSNISIPIDYSACEKNWIAEKINQAPWLSLTKDNDNLMVNLQENTGTVSRSETIRLSNPGNLSTTSFTIKQLAEFKLDLATSLSGGASVNAIITGGKAPYTIKWYVNNVLQTETGTEINLAMGQSYLIRCEVTDSYSTAQLISKEITFATYTPLVLSRTISLLDGIFTMQVFASGGTPSYTYTWYKNDVLINAVGSTYTAKFKTGDIYSCRVTDHTKPIQAQWIYSVDIVNAVENLNGK